MNAYEVTAGIGVIAGCVTVSALRVGLLQNERYINTLTLPCFNSGHSFLASTKLHDFRAQNF